MNKKKLDSLLWENIPFGNIMILGNDAIKQENLDEVFWDYLDELSVSRDEDYNIKITCVRNLNKFKINNQRNAIPQNDFVPGEVVPSGRLEIKINEDYTVAFSPMYCNGYESKLDKTNYRLSCYHVEGKSTKNPFMIKEWILNGSDRGLFFCTNSKYKFIVEGGCFWNTR